MGFPRQEYWRGLPLRAPHDFPDPPYSRLLHWQVDSFTTEPPGKPPHNIHSDRNGETVYWRLIWLNLHQLVPSFSFYGQPWLNSRLNQSRKESDTTERLNWNWKAPFQFTLLDDDKRDSDCNRGFTNSSDLEYYKCAYCQGEFTSENENSRWLTSRPAATAAQAFHLKRVPQRLGLFQRSL